jgi:hypothetical protein
VWKDKKDGGKLYLHLRHSGKKYNKRKGKNSGADRWLAFCSAGVLYWGC